MAYETEEHSVPEGFTHLGEPLHELEIAFSSHGGKDSKEPKVHYPELHFDGKHAEHLMKQLGKHGVAKIHYKKISESTHHSTRDGKTKTHHRVGIQIHGIKPESGDSGKEISMKTPKENPEDSIEKGLEAAEADQTA